MEYTNKELYNRCLELSGKIMKYRNQFIALLPEVHRRQLYLEHNMNSVYEFALKLAGLSHDTVRRVLKLEMELTDKPILKKIFDEGEIGWSKIEVATKITENIGEEKLGRILPSMSKSALQKLEKDLRTKNVDNASVGLPSQNSEIFSELHELPDENIHEKPELENFTIKLKPETISQLRVIKQQLEKDSKHPLTWEQAVSAMIEKLQNPVPAKPVRAKTKQKAYTTRHIPADIKRETLQKTKHLCAKCYRPAENLHHQIPFAISKNHDSIIPLCKDHHIIEHHKEESYINRKFQRCRS